ncbi:hypothetical protein VNO80_16805 [Phaseolus coccineus]|uniref:Uncharacterized protein n=1 Tax=Phaseolus coccineus TaxID=3886 RepID=A0AAN9R3L0_PHACN
MSSYVRTLPVGILYILFLSTKVFIIRQNLIRLGLRFRIYNLHFREPNYVSSGTELTEPEVYAELWSYLGL